MVLSLFRFDVGVTNDFSPFVAFVFDERGNRIES